MRPPPRFLFLTINEVCNLRCRHCLYWRSKRHPQIPIGRQLELVEELAELAPRGKVVICGGEPMLDEAAYFSVCATSRRLGLRTLSVINGTQIRDRRDAQRMIDDGPDEVSVSLDHPSPKIHDEVRRREGSHRAATTALSLLLAARGSRAQPRIYAMGLLCRSTCRHLDEFYDLVLDKIGADKLKLNALQPTFLNTRGEAGQEPESDDFFARESQVDPVALRKTLLRCNREHHLHLNPRWVDQVCSYFGALWRVPASRLRAGWTCGVNTPGHYCDSADRNIMIDLDGCASLCFSQAFRQARLSRPGDMRRFWETSDDVREAMRSCDRLCGISHSVRSSSATLERRKKR
jgi:MoaA/NifB/PqqE/SkfB family radical SAM enzyme